MDSQTEGNKGESILNKLPFINQLKQNQKMLLLIIGVVLIAVSSCLLYTSDAADE